MSTKGSSGDDGFFDDDWFKSDDDESFWDDDAIDAFDKADEAPKEDDPSDEAPKPEAQEAAAEQQSGSRAQAFVPGGTKADRKSGSLPSSGTGPFLAPPAAAGGTPKAPIDNAPDKVPDTALFSAPTLIFPRDEEDEEAVAAPPAAAAPEAEPEQADDAPPEQAVRDPDVGSDAGVFSADTMEMPRDEAEGLLAMYRSHSGVAAPESKATDAAETRADSQVGFDDLPTEMAGAPRPNQPPAPEDLSYSDEELELARAERQARLVAPDVPATDGGTGAQASTLEHYAPEADPDSGWREAAQALEQEAEALSDPQARAAALSDAGVLYYSRCGDWGEASRCLSAARELGSISPHAMKCLGNALAQAQNHAALADLLEARSAQLSGTAAAEALHDAALVSRNQLKDLPRAAALLVKAREQDPEDWLTLKLHREVLYATEAWGELASTLAVMAEMNTGPEAARLHVERARVLEQRVEDLKEANAAYAAAANEEASNVDAFLGRERIALGAGDQGALASLYRAAAERVSGADQAFLSARAARAAAAAGDTESARTDWARAVSAEGKYGQQYRHEQQAFLQAAGAHADLRDSLTEEADTLSGPERAAALYRLAVLLETALDAPDQALEAYQGALAADPTVAPATAAVARLLDRTGQHAELLTVLENSLASVKDPNQTVAIQYRMGEICEGAVGDLDGARKWYDTILKAAPEYLPALDGAVRVYERQEAWADLAGLYERRAERADGATSKAMYLHRSGAVFDEKLSDPKQAKQRYAQALTVVPHFPPSLDAFNRIASDEGDWSGLSEALQAAADSVEQSTEEVSLRYRAARILADKGGDPSAAINALRRCLELSPGFQPAVALFRDLAASSGDWQSVYELQRAEAAASTDNDAKVWSLLVASHAAEHLDDVDAVETVTEAASLAPGHAGARAAMALAAWGSGQTDRLIELLSARMMDSGATPEARALAASLLVDAAAHASREDALAAALEVATGNTDPSQPAAALAWVAEGRGHWEKAVALRSHEGDADRARILETWSADPDVVADAWRGAFTAHPEDINCAAGFERASRRAGSTDGLSEAHRVLAGSTPAPAVSAVHAMLCGHLQEAAGDVDAAAEQYDAALQARPDSPRAFDAVQRVGLQLGNHERLSSLYKDAGDENAINLVDALTSAGALEDAEAVLKARLGEGEPDLRTLVYAEQVGSMLGNWADVFEVLELRAQASSSEEARNTVAAKQRWVLAEHLAETDKAWDFYRQLHEQNPEDVEVLEALARIAGARGETALAVGFLEGLVASASGAAAARYHRRIAEAHRHGGDTEAAVESLMRALEQFAEDSDSLQMLEDIHRGGENWRSLVGVLARRATIETGDDQTSCYRSIAQVWEEQIGDARVAIDAWRKVLELEPADAVALEQLVTLTRSEEDWASFVEHGQSWARQLDSDDARVALQAEIGHVLHQKLRRDDDALRLLDAATSGDSPDLEAAKLLEKIYQGQGNWAMAVDGVLRQARALVDEAAVEQYIRAARIRIETLHDRDGASEVYREILKIDTNHAESLRFLGGYAYDAGNLQEAIDLYTKLASQEIERDLDDFDEQIEVGLFFFRFAEALRQLDRAEEALGRYEQGLKLNPSHLPSLEAVGPLYMEAGRWEDVSRVYRQILQLTGGQGDPERLARTYTNLGHVELNLSNLDKAKKRFNKALELRPNDIRALQGVAKVLFAREDWNNLLNVYNNIIYHAQDPSEVVDAYLTKGFVLDAKMDLPEKAKQHFEKSLAFDPSQPAALVRLAELALRDKDWPEAVRHADAAEALKPDDAELAANLKLVRAVALAAAGDNGAASAAQKDAAGLDAGLKAAMKGSPSMDDTHTLLRERLHTKL